MARVRRFRRVAPPAVPFVPWGLVPLGGLGLLALGALPLAARIETVVRETAQAALQDAGKPWVTVEASGQWVVLGGIPPSPEDGQGAEAIVRAATADTWLGALAPATHVTSRFEAPPICTPPPPPPTGWSFRLLAGELLLGGELPDPARERVEAAARGLLQPPRVASVRNELAVRQDAGTEADLAVALRGIEAVGRCDSGEAALRSGVFSLRCELAREVEAEVREQATAPLPPPLQLGEVVLLVTEEIESCEEALAALLESATIEFDTDSAEIGPGSRTLLDQVAAEAHKCPGTLRVEGHTDDQGTEEHNRDLSRRRAEAVRAALVERGLAEERLVAEGFGDSVPRADNATPGGRARNRRIEIEVVRSHQ